MTTNDDMDAVFAALAHTTRRTMLDIIRDQPGITVGRLAARFDVSRITAMQHLTVLTQSGLIIDQKDGRSRKLYLNAAPLQEIHARWIDQYAAHWADRALFIKQVAEAAAAKKDTGDDNG
ncbi:ArsR/SmtB family transcription factor [Maritimibacter dapengensis]|uniref:ArsR family transcriptional regulator n=1 Tax=Maritimibacter dapengensis TaxID=2836868 RepID=A0ABS6T3D3_9RHOB|nr:helix-turn-helix transcriptional regulator [Maritimibacter dapengensis]MBV7379218.1 ArsR family transcriptional regulator [Maritimibacter dapengensis]